MVHRCDSPPFRLVDNYGYCFLALFHNRRSCPFYLLRKGMQKSWGNRSSGRPIRGSRLPVPGLCSLSTSGSQRLCLNPSQMQSLLDCGKPAGLRPVTRGAEPSSLKNFSWTVFFLPRQSSRILKAQVSHTRSLPGSVSSPSTTKRGNNFKQVPLFGLRGSDLRQGSVN